MRTLKQKIYIVIATIASLSAFSQTKISRTVKITDIEINGTANVCANLQTDCVNGSLYTYNITGIPAGATNIYILWNEINGTSCTSNIGQSNTVRWSNSNTCDASAEISAWGEYTMGTDVIQIPLTKLPINITSIGDISPISWNISPYMFNPNNLVYSINPVCGATAYQWTIPTGWAAQTPLTGTSIIVTPNTTSGGVVSVVAINNSNGCNLSTSFSQNVTRPIEKPILVAPASGICLDNTPTKTYYINPVPNAISYTWTYPVGWTGTVATNGLSSFVNFNSNQQVGNICVNANFPGGISSALTCVNVTAVFGAPFPPSYSPNITATPSPTIGKWQVQVYFPTIPGGNYNWTTSVQKYQGGTPSYGPSNNHSGISSGLATAYYIMSNNDKIQINASRTNPCTTSDGNSYGFKFNNGAFTPYQLLRTGNLNIVDETEGEIDYNFNIFPNPANNNLNITYFSQENSVMNIVITDVLGNIVLNVIKDLSEGNNEFKLQLDGITNGIYFVNIDGKGFSNKKKIVIVK